MGLNKLRRAWPDFFGKLNVYRKCHNLVIKAPSGRPVIFGKFNRTTMIPF